MSKAADLVNRMNQLGAPAPRSPAPMAIAESPPDASTPLRSGNGRRRGRGAGAVRLTVDLDPELHRSLRMFALHERADASEVVRALLQLLDDPVVRRSVAEALHG